MTSICLKRGRETGSPQPSVDKNACSPHRWNMEQLVSPSWKRSRVHGEAVAESSSAFMGGAGEEVASSSAGDVSAVVRPQRTDPATGEPLFSLEQVKDIVRHACDERERTLREAYDKILGEKLQEQYQSFAKFNEDYISRQLKASDLQSYVS